MPIISLIWAMADNRVIGQENRLPWKLPVDMKWFRLHTLGKPVIMGRKTFESFGARPLPERTNIVVSRDPDYAPIGVLVANSLDQALELAGDVREVMVIGGARLYEQMLPRADRLYITRVHANLEGDTWFPEFDLSDWQEIEFHEHPADEKNKHACRFSIFERAGKR